MTGPDGGIGRRAGLKHLWSKGRAGSTPALGTGKALLRNQGGFVILGWCSDNTDCRPVPHSPKNK
jgi:hypothetical protein